MVTSLPSKPTENQDPWYTTMVAWMDGVALNVNELNAQTLLHIDSSGTLKPVGSHLPVGGTSGQVLSKSSGTDYAVGWVNQSGSSLTPPILFESTANNITVTVKSHSTATGQVFRAVNSSDVNLFDVNVNGEARIGLGTAQGIPAGTFRVTPSATTAKGMVVRALSGNTANLYEGQVGTSTLFSVNSDGSITAPNIGVPVIVLTASAPVPGGTINGTVILRRP